MARLTQQVPTSAVITGPLNGVGIRHFCLALQGWNGHHTVDALEESEKLDCGVLGCVLAQDTEVCRYQNLLYMSISYACHIDCCSICVARVF